MPIAEQDTTYVKIKAKCLCVYEHMQMHKGDRKRSRQNRDGVSSRGGKWDWGGQWRTLFIFLLHILLYWINYLEPKYLYISYVEKSEKYNNKAKYMRDTKGWPQKLVWRPHELCNFLPFSLSSEPSFAQEWVHAFQMTSEKTIKLWWPHLSAAIPWAWSCDTNRAAEI